MMSRVNLGPEGPDVSRLAYGVWRLLDDPAGCDVRRIRSKIDACLQVGITTFDHAAIYGGYGCEAAFGVALADAPGLRDQMELVSKCGIEAVHPARTGNRCKHYDYRKEQIIGSAEQSLRNLRTDRLDLFLLHRPSPMLDPDEAAGALVALRKAGKIRYAGVSNFTPAQFDLLASRLDFPLVTNQVEASVLCTTAFVDGTLDHLMRLRRRPMAWSPTGGGRLFTGQDEQACRVRTTLQQFAGAYGARLEQLAYAWLLAHPSSMQVVIGTNDIERIRVAADSRRFTLDLQDWFAVWAASTGRDVP